MSKSQMAHDIDRWGADRMSQWLDDLMQRYDMADISLETAIAHTTATLLVVTAKFVAASDVSEEEAGKVFGSFVVAARKDLNKFVKGKMKDGSS
jgi:hypothetical protein